MNAVSKISSEKTSPKKQWNREEQTDKVIDFEKSNLSQRGWAKKNEVSRTTLQRWLTRKKDLDASPELIHFFESELGLAFLHRLILAVHFIFTKVGNASIHNIHEFLTLSGLSSFVGSSYGSQQKVSTAIDTEIVSFAQDEKDRLCLSMPHKKIAIAEDETFHPEICMVAVELISNFILVEEYVEKRDQVTWNRVIEESLSDLNVEVLQVTSDEGKGIVSHVQNGLGVHHSTDVFHPLYEISKGTSAPMSSLVKKMEKKHQESILEIQKIEKQRACYDTTPQRGRRPHFEKRLQEAEKIEKEAKEEVKKAEKNQENVKKARKEIGRVYHPFCLETGEKQDANRVEELLENCFEQIYGATQSLSEKCLKHVFKAHRLVPKMKQTIFFFFFVLEVYLEEVQVSPEIKNLMETHLIPGFYLKLVAQKEKDIEKKERIQLKSQELLSFLEKNDHRLTKLEDHKFQQVLKISQECAQIFQRSSSSVEGRNAQLSLRHHSLHRLNSTKLQALTAIHNYHLKRKDGTTAAERFFEEKPTNLFEHLLDHINLPVRPRRRLKKQPA